MPATLSPSLPGRPRSFHVMTKPIGPICNLDCKYCFYLEKEKMYPDTRKWAMPDDVLEEYIRQYINCQSVPEVTFAWQGGEPTLLGVDFFRRVVALQKKYADGRTIHNALQTNGTLLDDEWCEFLGANRVLVGLSIDGPPEMHDLYRVDKKQQPTFNDVVRGLELMKKHGVEFNTLTVVHRHNATRPLEIYHFLKQIGSGFMQFIPLVERQAVAQVKIKGFDLMEPPEMGRPIPAPVTDWSVRAEDYGQFLCTIFDEWVRHDVGKYFVQMFDVALGQWVGQGSSLCVFAEKCGSAMAMERNGDLFSCDHYVYPKYKLGNIMHDTLGEMAASEQQQKFGADKSDTLPRYCRECSVRFACNGECPKHRFIRTPDGEEGLNYLCAGYKQFFTHIDPAMRVMANLFKAQKSPALIMEILRGNAQMLCPCGSGMKLGRCCARHLPV
jgi:uncharacterized protein